MRNLLALTLLLLTATGAGAASIKTDIDRFVTATLKDIPDLTSVGIAVVRDGKPYYAAGFGWADVEKKTRAGADTGYYIASSTKSYTGLAVAVLASRGVLDLDAPIAKYLPEVTSDAGKITLRQFLTHTAPITNEAIVFRTAFSGQHTPALLVNLLNSSKPRKAGFQYDNLGYVVASLVIERVTGKPWQKALDELVFAPLGMSATTAYMSAAQRRPLASPYDMNRKAEMVRLQFAKNDQMMHAAGGIVTTPADLTRWLAANVSGSRRIPAAAFAEVHRQQTAATAERDAFKGSGYGFGWYQADYAGDKVLFHMGGFEGWRAHVSFMPDKKLGVAVVTNSGGYSGRVLNLIAAYVYDRLLEKPNAEATNAEALAKMKATAQTQRERFLAEVAKRAQRPWMLKHPNAAYAGRYESPLYGTMIIEEHGEKLVASLADLRSEVEAFTDPESARVELIPGSGSVLRFTFNGDAVESMKWDDEEFRPVK
jgi:CubicO group peptidase (beta-lactamase class C family)